MTDPTSAQAASQAAITSGLANRPVTVASLSATLSAILAPIFGLFLLMGTWSNGTYTPNIPAGSITAAKLAPGAGITTPGTVLLPTANVAGLSGGDLVCGVSPATCLVEKFNGQALPASGLLKASNGSLVAAVAGTDYLSPTGTTLPSSYASSMLTSLGTLGSLNVSGTGTAAVFSAGTIQATGTGGVVIAYDRNSSGLSGQFYRSAGVNYLDDSVGGHAIDWTSTAVALVLPTTVSATTASTSSTTGALVDAGGLGVAGNANIGGTLNTVGAAYVGGITYLAQTANLGGQSAPTGSQGLAVGWNYTAGGGGGETDFFNLYTSGGQNNGFAFYSAIGGSFLGSLTRGGFQMAALSSAPIVNLYSFPPANYFAASGSGATLSIASSAGHVAGDSLRTGTYSKCTTTASYTVQETCGDVDMTVGTGGINNWVASTAYPANSAVSYNDNAYSTTGGGTTSTASPPIAAPWTASTAYAVGNQVLSNGNRYTATAAGTSASSGGPSGTGSAITDGTVTWSYTSAGTGVPDGTVTWTYVGPAINNGKEGLSMAVAMLGNGIAGDGNTWGGDTTVTIAPNAFPSVAGGSSILWEYDVANNAEDCVPASPTACASFGLFLEGIATQYTNTVGILLGGSGNSYYYYHWGVAMLSNFAKDIAYMDASNAPLGFESRGTRVSTGIAFDDISSGGYGARLWGTYAAAALDITGATLNANKIAVALPINGQLCLNSYQGCLLDSSVVGGLVYNNGANNIFAATNTGFSVTKGSLYLSDTSPLINFSVLSAGSAGTINKINLYNSAYGLGVSSGSLDYVVPSSSAHSFYVGGSLAGQITSAGFSGAGGSITALNATQLTSGTAPIPVLGNVYTIPFTIRNVQLNTTGDTPITITLPTGFSLYFVNGVRVANPSAVLSGGAAKVGIYTAASQGGTVIAAQQVLTGITTTSQNTSGNMVQLSIINNTTTTFNVTTLYFNVGTANGSAATVDVTLNIGVQG